MSQSVASQFGVAATHAGLQAHLHLTRVRNYLLKHINDGSLQSNENIWLGQLRIEYDVLREALVEYLVELEHNPSPQLAVRLPRLGVVLAESGSIVASSKPPRIVVVDWVSLPAGSRWLGLNFGRADRPVQCMSLATMSNKGNNSLESYKPSSNHR